MNKQTAAVGSTLPLQFPTDPIGSTVHLICAPVSASSDNRGGPWSDLLNASRPSIVACFDGTSDYMVARFAIPSPSICAVPVLNELLDALTHFGASASKVIDHDSLLTAWRINQGEWLNFVDAAVLSRTCTSRMASLRANRHRSELLRTLANRRLHTPFDRDNALAAFLATHNFSKPNQFLGGETPADVFMRNRTHAVLAKEAEM